MKHPFLLVMILFSVLSCEKKNEVKAPDQTNPTNSTSSQGVISTRREGGGGETLTCGQLRTQSQGGWGTEPHGNNPGTYLYANFANAFPSGLTVGCSPDFNITLTTEKAVSDFLPSGGRAQSLTRNYIDPIGMKNVLAGQLVALSLSIGFDEYDENFGTATMPLGEMKIKTGAFETWTVSNFLTEANKVLGGCSTSFTVQQVLETASNINENYLDGNSDKGYLICPND